MSLTVRPLFEAEVLAKRIHELAREIALADHKDLLVIAVLRGSFVFAADLIRAMHDAELAPQIEFLQLSSYKTGTTSTGSVDVVRDIDSDVTGRDVILVDDILESGRTLAYAKNLLIQRGAREVMTCVLLDKPGKRTVDINADYVGFECPDYFVVGYGMDVAHSYRQLPFVGVVEEDGVTITGGP
ncbi:hypoxanthine phosphoribosyltransferase [Flaviflagellibacter deserti]|jgi:hypoxanthine phosphoribosyltransferase|uniref:Hypoxanthine phosphoribosyltransferase n=1 Tax=Flaviflagellibacter deserti TaxID=2267266 RepID=A0ABV9Z0I3_9HYPH